ncbi:MAG: nucleotidyltransferase family protein [Candidatus Magasanikbacteria bacterium]
MKILILAGGRGTRLGQLGEQIVKPMIKIAGKPVLEYQVELLKSFGLVDITFVVGHRHDQIRSYFRDGKKWGVKINYWDKDSEIGTAGSIKVMEKELTDDFFVIYGDLLFNIDLEKMLATHQENKTKFKDVLVGTLLVQPTNHPQDCDLLEVNEDSVITNIFSKPHSAGVLCQNLNNAAIYIFTLAIFKYIASGKTLDFGRDIFPDIVINKLGILCAHQDLGYLQDMGTPDRLAEVEADVLSGRFGKGITKTKITDFIYNP